MKSTFSKFILAPAVLPAAALAATSATAETTVNVPFKFSAAGQACPAGSYTVRHDQNSNYVTLSRKGTSKSFMYILGLGAADPADDKIALNFDQVGGAHVLQSIQYGPHVTGRLDKKT